MEAHELKNCEKLFQNIVFVCMLSCQNTVNTGVFGWFALRTGSKKMKKTVSAFYAFAKKQCKYQCCWTIFALDAAKNVKASVFSSKGINMPLDTVFFLMFLV